MERNHWKLATIGIALTGCHGSGSRPHHGVDAAADDGGAGTGHAGPDVRPATSTPRLCRRPLRAHIRRRAL